MFFIHISNFLKIFAGLLLMTIVLLDGAQVPASDNAEDIELPAASIRDPFISIYKAAGGTYFI